MSEQGCTYRLSISHSHEGQHFCANPRVHMKNNIIRSNECDSCRYKTNETVQDMRTLPRQLRPASEVPSCFFRDTSTLDSVSFDCFHPSHECATNEFCRLCPDFKERLHLNSVHQWAVGITTAPREKSTFDRTVESLSVAGWPEDQLHVFAEPGTFSQTMELQSPVTIRGRRVGAFPNWYLSLEELVLTQPNADAYLLCQDDIVACRNLRQYLERVLWPHPVVAFVSLYCGTLQSRTTNKEGFFRIDKSDLLYGALSIVFPAASARAILLDPYVQRHRDGNAGTYGIDSVLASWASETGLPAFVHFPSLIGHTGVTSAIFKGAGNDPSRCSDSFVGEDHDAVRSMF